MKIGRYNYNRVCSAMPCPICGRTKFCLISDNGDFIICTKVESRHCYPDHTGWLHRLVDKPHLKPRRIIQSADHTKDKLSVCRKYASLCFSHEKLQPLADMLHLPVKVFASLGVGSEKNQYYFPMIDGDCDICGLKIRNLDNNKWCFKGSSLGVYTADNFNQYGEVYVCEGESDVAALLAHGYNAIGRPSANSCYHALSKIVSNNAVVTIVSDNDESGLGLSTSLDLAGHIARPVNIIVPTEYKDVREWILSGTFSRIKLNHLKKPLSFYGR